MSTESISNDRRAAEYLANERTFLAWIRTAIALLSLGLALAKFGVWFRDLAASMGRSFPVGQGTSMPVGEILMGFGGALAVLAAWHYHAINLAIEEDRVRPNRGLIILITLGILLLALAGIIAVHLVTPAG
jgi:putative membrane protein